MISDVADKIRSLQEDKKVVLKKIKCLDSVFEEEKDNEESWPGHASTRYQTADIDRQVLLEHLRSIEEAIKQLTKEEPLNNINSNKK